MKEDSRQVEGKMETGSAAIRMLLYAFYSSRVWCGIYVKAVALFER